MIVYVVIKSGGDGFTYSWEEIDYIYLNKDRAEWECILLNEKFAEDPDTEFYVREHSVDTSKLED